jgi:LysM repeat protein
MNILKILGIVVAVHVVAFFLMFVNPGCRSTTQRPTPADTGTMASASSASTQGALNPGTAPVDSPASVSVNIPSSPAVRYSPTRPGSAAAAALEGPVPVEVTPTTTYTVVAGDSLWMIAKKHGTTVNDLARANKLTSNSKLSVGQKLLIPGKAMPGAADVGAAAEAGAGYIVKAGDTLAGIARHAGTTTAELKRVNSLKSDYVRVGQELKLPSGIAPSPAETVATAAPAPGATAAPVKKPEGALIHVVKPGETLGAIARKYQVKVSDLAVINNIADPRKIRPGQELVVPGFTPVSGAAPAMAPAGSPPAAAASAAPSLDQDLDAGLKPKDSVPVIKVDETGTPKTP